MAEYRKFKLQPGQQAPSGSLGIGLKDGYIAYFGDDIPAEITSESMNLNEYKRLRYDQFITEFNQYRENTREYPIFKMMDLVIQYLWAKEQPSTPLTNIILNRFDSFINWYKDVLIYQHNVKKDIKDATTFNEVESISWDLEQFDNSDPAVG